MKRTSDLEYDWHINAFKDDVNRLYIPYKGDQDPPEGYSVDWGAGVFVSPGHVHLVRLVQNG